MSRHSSWVDTQLGVPVVFFFLGALPARRKSRRLEIDFDLGVCSKAERAQLLKEFPSEFSSVYTKLSSLDLTQELYSQIDASNI